MDERDFIEWYCDDSAFETAVNYYAFGVPVLYAGYLDYGNGKAIFFITQEDPDYEYSCYVVCEGCIMEEGAANSFDEIADILASWLN